MLVSGAVGLVLQATGSYLAIFAMARHRSAPAC